MTRRASWTAIGSLWAAIGLVVTASSQRPVEPLSLMKGDHIAIIGNTLAERFQMDGWLEARIQTRFPDHQLTVRNLGFSGDEINTRLRSMNFGTPDEWLSGVAKPIGGYNENRLATTNTKADVVFAFFGYNESYAGEAGLGAFRTQLRDWVTHTLQQRYNGRSAPRLVIFSPIAHEDLANPDLPTGQENNTRLALYTRAMSEVATAAGVRFVDLFAATTRLYAERTEPLTINGVHLNTAGHAAVSEVVDRELFGGGPAIAAASLERVRQAVVDKDFHWFHRYRVTDGYSTYGERAFLNFVRGVPRNVNRNQLEAAAKENILPTNYDTLQSELPVLDVMTSNRDKRIWALAAGRDLAVDDSNVPPIVAGKTNLTQVAPFIEGDAAVKLMTVGAGLKVELFASEREFPELVNPVQLAFDTRGRLWVAVWKNYPHWQPGQPMDDKLLILEDTNGDGRADKRTVFAGDLHAPTGFEFWNGGVILAQQPNLVFLKDTNGDDRSDEKRILLHGFDTADTHHGINSFAWDPGGALYMQEGVFHRTQVETPWAPTLRQADGGVYRFEPRTWKLDTYVPMQFPNPHGHVFDGWGRDVIFDGTGGHAYYGPSFSTKKYYPAMESTSAPKLGPVGARPVGGTEILSSRHFPESMQGNLIVLNTIGFRGLLNFRLMPDGAGLQIVPAEPLVESSDPNFRPVDSEIAPDGSLYLLDWHNPVIGHMQHNLRDTSRDRLHGRVYRVTYPGRPLIVAPRVSGTPIPELLELLKAPEMRTRNRVKIELSARDTDQVLAAVQAWAGRLDPADPNVEHHRMEALWVHQWHNRVNEPLLRQMLQSSEPLARAAATRVLCYWRDRVPGTLDLLKALVKDSSPAVRLEAVRAASFFTTSAAAEVALASLESSQEPDRFLKHTLDQTMKTLERFLK